MPLPNVANIKSKINTGSRSADPFVRSLSSDCALLLASYENERCDSRFWFRSFQEEKKGKEKDRKRAELADKLLEENKELRDENRNLRSRAVRAEKSSVKLQKLYEDKCGKMTTLQEEMSKKDQEISELKKKLERATRGNSENTNFPSRFDVCQKSKAVPKTEGGKDCQDENLPADVIEQKNIKRCTLSSRTKTDRKRGGQKGHPAHRKSLIDNPDKVVTRHVKKAPSGAVKCQDENGNFYYAVQSTSLELQTIVTETRYYLDPDGETLPEEKMQSFKVNSSNYSCELIAFVLFMSTYVHVPAARLASTLKSLSHGKINLSAGTICSWRSRLAEKVRSENKEAIERMMKENVLYVDETGIKILGELYWVHVLCSSTEAVYILTETRGDKTNSPTAILEEKGYTGNLIHDHFAAYQMLEKVTHGECNNHILRYMKNGLTFDKSEECQEMIDFYGELRQRKAELQAAGQKEMKKEERDKARERFVDICQRGMDQWEKKVGSSQDPEMMKKYTPPYYRTLRRMKKNPEDYLRFINDFNVPFGNNRAEQCVGFLKSQLRVSKQCVTENGAEVLLELLSFTECRKSKNEDLLTSIETLLSAEV